ncbi:MAG: hypothetical protein NC191_10285 [Muribaculaceae bacterium]|nr:hypothetical protein [Muribaculaceae bacterium]
MLTKYENVKNDFLRGKLKGCKSFFEENGYYIEAAYCCIVLDKLDKAREFFERAKAKDGDIRADWGLFLIQLIRGDISSYPTYFWIRNFLEIDINILITYCKSDYIAQIIRYADFLAYYNPECYKFFARVFWANNMMPASEFFLGRAKDKFYQDPELHYLIAYIRYYNDKNKSETKKALEACLKILPEYFPARNLLAKLD